MTLSTNTFKYHVFAPMGIFQLELIYLCFTPSFHLIVGCFCPVGLSFSTGLVGVEVTSVSWLGQYLVLRNHIRMTLSTKYCGTTVSLFKNEEEATLANLCKRIVIG